MNISKRILSSVVAASTMLSASPAFALVYNNPIQASMARCNELAGREKDRCETIHRRVERLRLRQTANTYDRGNTLREQRILRPTTQPTSIRRTNQPNLSRLRRHDRDGGNARRLINRRDAEARAQCRGFDSTERYQCIRENWRNLSRGNTR